MDLLDLVARLLKITSPLFNEEATVVKLKLENTVSHTFLFIAALINNINCDDNNKYNFVHVEYFHIFVSADIFQ